MIPRIVIWDFQTVITADPKILELPNNSKILIPTADTICDMELKLNFTADTATVTDTFQIADDCVLIHFKWLLPLY